jgi:hypothetical protein
MQQLLVKKLKIITNLKTWGFLANKYFQLSMLYTLAFLAPFLLKTPQLLTGTLINFLLILSISQFKFKNVLPVLILPSLSVYTFGLIFGGASTFLLYLIPFITIANGIYVLSYKQIKTEFLNILLASILKASFLFLSTYILVKTVGIPQTFLTAMGITQLLTALLGGLTASSLTLILNKKYSD